MIKKSVLFVTSLFLGFAINQAQDEAKKPTEKEKTEVVKPASNYSIPTKKVEEFSKQELMDAVMYYRGLIMVDQIGKEKDLDAKVFIQGMEEKQKNPALVVEQAEWQALVAQYQEVKKTGGEISADLKTKLSKNQGVLIATDFVKNGYNTSMLISGFHDKTANKDLAIPEGRMKEIGEKLQSIMIDEEKSVGKKFLEENKKKEGVVTLPSGLQYKIINKGEGATGTDGQTVKVHYAGTTIDGKEFDSSFKRNQPFEVVLPGQVIKGWQEALKLMPKGSKWQVFIPENLAYGERGAGNTIKPYSTLIFEMEILDITGSAVPPTQPLK